MTNEELIDAIRDGDQDNSLLMQLWEQNTGLVRKACRKYSRRIEEEDATQECFIAFLDAVEGYDREAGQTFASYFLSRCQWHLIRCIDNCGSLVRIPVYQRQALHRYRRFIREWYQMFGALPDSSTICIALGLSQKQLERLRKDIQADEVASLDRPLSKESDSEATIADIVEDHSAEVERTVIDSIFEDQKRQAVWKAVDQLENQRERQAIRLYYQDGLTYKEVGQVMGLSHERIRVLIASGLKKLRTQKRYKALRGFTDLSAIYSKSISGVSVAAFNRTWTSSTEGAALWEIDRKLSAILQG